MKDMRYLYGMPKTASARREEFVGKLRNYFGSLRVDGMPVKTASEKREIVSGLLAKHASVPAGAPSVVNRQLINGRPAPTSKHAVKRVSFPDASDAEKQRRLAALKAKQDAAQAAYEQRKRQQPYDKNSYLALRNELVNK